ncbi:hypothetical protein BH23GEM9_BH23GEM9_11440 [soil metagenome]
MFRAASVTALLALIALPACDRAEGEGQQDWQTVNSSRRAAGEQVLRVDVEYGAGSLSLAPGASGVLYQANLRYDANVFRPVVEYADSRLRVGVNGSTGNTGRTRNVRAGELDLRLGTDVPVEIDLKFGAAEANIDLGGIPVRRLQVQTGASKTLLSVSRPNPERCQHAEFQLGAARFEATGLGNLNVEHFSVQGGVGEMILDFTGAWSANMSAKVDMGLGSLTLRMPRGLGVRVGRTGVLTSFDSQGLVKRGDSYYSETWETAARRLSLDLNTALGSVRVVWIDS